jgi:hypothetical protein
LRVGITKHSAKIAANAHRIAQGAGR